MDIFKRTGLRTRAGFTLVEILVTCSVLVIAFALMAIVFGKVMTVRNAIHSSSNAENLAAYLMDTILYGPAVQEGAGTGGIVNYGLLNAAQSTVVLNAAAGWNWNNVTGYGPRAQFQVYNGAVPPVLRTVDFDFHPSTTYPAAVPPWKNNTLTGQWGIVGNLIPGYTSDLRDLRPNWAIDKRLQVYYNVADTAYTSGFWFYTENGSVAGNSNEIRWIAIRITVVTEGQQPNEGVTIWRYVRFKNQPPL